MKRRLSFMLVFILALSIILTGCGGESDTGTGSDNANDDKVITIRVSHVLQEDNPSHLALINVFKPQVEEKTDGKIKVEIYPNAQLGSDRQAIESVSVGSLEMTQPGGAVLSGFNEEFMIFDLPFLYKDKESAYDAWDGEVGKKVSEGLEEHHNIKILAYGENGYRHITNNLHPIHTPEDLKGMKIRVMENPIHLATFKALGANPTPIAFGELFTALQQKTVDAQENPLAIIHSSKFHEVQKYLTISGHVFGNAPYLINKDFYESLSPEHQQIISDAIQEAAVYQRNMITEQETTYLQELIDAGMEVNELTDEEKELFIEASKPSYDMFIEKFGDELIKLAQSYNK